LLFEPRKADSLPSVVVHRNTENRKAAILVCLVEFDEPRDFNLAWTTPGSPEIDGQLFAGLVFLSAAPHPVCAGSADTARKNAGAIAIRVGLAGIPFKATAGRVVRRDRVELVGGIWPQEYFGERGTPLRHRNGVSQWPDRRS
jgi:hypothetical protein